MTTALYGLKVSLFRLHHRILSSSVNSVIKPPQASYENGTLERDEIYEYLVRSRAWHEQARRLANTEGIRIPCIREA